MPTLDQLLAELNQLVLLDPEKARAVFAAHPELSAPVFGNLRKEELAAQVRASDSPESFFAYYELKNGGELPAHMKRHIKKIYADHAEGTGTVNHASRGFRKTTALGVDFMTYRVGKEPHKTNVAIGANDDSPEKVMNAVSVIIESHPEFKRCFPDVEPDKGRGWSVNGYYVKDTSMEYQEWVKKQGSTVDPTLVGGGYNSTRINGKHPTGILYIDDIHDINNNSDIQRKDVVKKLTTVILKTVIRVNDKLSTWVLGVGVPWATDDGYQTMVNAGYGYIRTPAMMKAKEGDEGAVYIDGLNEVMDVVYEDIQGWWVLTWPENFGVKSIVQERSFGKTEFWQMIMLDLATASTGKLIYHEFPHDQISYDWPTLGGCDPTTFDNITAENRASHFALAYVAKKPTGGAVIIDGVLEQCTLLQGENYILSAQSKFKNWLYVAIEAVSVGKVFYQAIIRNSMIRAVLSGLKGISDARVRSKKDRWANDAAKFFEDGTVLISDADTPFLNALRRLFNHFYDLSEHDPAWDAGDAVYHALRQMPDVLRQTHTESREERRKRTGLHPLAGINTYTGY